MGGGISILDAADINFLPQKLFDETESMYDLNDMTLTEKLENMEQNIIDRVLKDCNGNVSKAAERMGIKRQSLQYKIKKYSAK